MLIQVRLSDPELQAALQLALKFNDLGNWLWQFYVVFTTAVVGWIFSKKEPWSRGQRTVATVLFVACTAMNLVNLGAVYNTLDTILAEVRALSANLQTRTELATLMRTVPARGGWWIPAILHAIADPLVLYCIWGLDGKKAQPPEALVAAPTMGTRV